MKPDPEWPYRPSGARGPVNIHIARFRADPLDGNPCRGQAFGFWIVYYAVANDTLDFARKLEDFANRERWKLWPESVEGGLTSRERLASKPWILESLDQHGEFVIIHSGQFSDD